MKKCTIILFICGTFFSCMGLPYRFTRVVSPDKTKTVDIIFDYHETWAQPEAAKAIRGGEFALLSRSERALLDQLRNLNRTSKQKIDLIWEYDPEISQYSTPEELWGRVGFIGYAPWQVKSEFTGGRNMQLVAGDTYRLNRRHFNLLINATDAADYKKAVELFPEGPLQSAQMALATITSLLDPQSAINQDFYALKNVMPEKQYQNLSTRFDLFKKTVHEYYEKIIEPILQDDPGISISAFIDALKKQNQLNYFAQDFFLDEVLTGVADFEFLFKVFASKNERVILYAGGDHGRNVLK